MDLLRVLSLHICIIITFKLSFGLVNITNWTHVRRQKRALIFANGGVCKLVCGVILPFELADDKPWRQMNLAVNLQAQYLLPLTPTYPWDKWKGRTLAEAKQQFDLFGKFAKDESRKFIYTAMEVYMDKKGKSGKQCLQRAICENAEVTEVEGIFAEILHIILKPLGDSSIHTDYIEAYEAGSAGAICDTLYPECPPGEGILDDITVTKHIKYWK